ncbi:MAG: Na(+)-translocating NADH-quinone reductase subunit C [Planctomycetaceae bacterium]|nr:Na(+)-translocating NADH-quinone reductase subunit C [Planctomycetaceae bacterium]
MKPETLKTFKIAIQLCLVCSVVVSTLAVGLKGIQDRQKENFRRQSILSAAGLWTDGADAEKLFQENITPVALDLETYDVSRTVKPGDKELQLEVAERTPALHDDLAPQEDIAGLKKREKFSTIYEVRDGDTVTRLILPIRGKGLWSTLFGFLALDVTNASAGPEGYRVAGITYYRHGETPGLGGEVENELWRAKWPGKMIYDNDWNVQVQVTKGADSDYEVDALSGATLTSNGVTNMLRFWLGDKGFGPYLKRLSGVSEENSADKPSETASAGHEVRS